MDAEKGVLSRNLRASLDFYMYQNRSFLQGER